MVSPIAELDPEQRAALDAGRHFEVAAALDEARRHGLAGWVYEQVWAFAEATVAYLAAGQFVDALRAAVESGDGELFDRTLAEAMRGASVPERRAAAELLQRRGRHLESSRLSASIDEVPVAQAQALANAGDRRSAAELLLASGDAHAALELLRVDSTGHSPAEHALAAHISWDLGDTEGTARHAQAAFRLGVDASQSDHLAALLARALSTLGYDLAAQLALGGDRLGETELPAARGRYLVTASMPTQYAGATYVGVDRVTLAEVELHLLLEARTPQEARDPLLSEAVERFFRAAVAGSDIGHPAIRPVLRTELDQALLVLPRAAGPTLHQQLRRPHAPVRARNLVAFLLQGLQAAHATGLVHGQILPLHIVSDALGRPLLGPFGAHYLAGLAATQTAGLAEVLRFTAPERRRGAPPTSASDIFAVGAIFKALLVGDTAAGSTGQAAGVSSEDWALVDAMTHVDPPQRPTARQALARLGLSVADITELYERPPTAQSTDPEPRPGGHALMTTLSVVASANWPAPALDTIAAASSPWVQTIVDRDEARFELAAWPPGCARLGPEAPWAKLAKTTLDAIGPELAGLLEDHLSHRSFVVTPAGDCMVALDTLLAP
ncbi:MAG: hypothetical protein B7733_18385 [Myxococcales bacterium FL481]|nr:MAG: hypothetical protein B7733_18385 [Myxococcales bacterium FL481]